VLQSHDLFPTRIWQARLAQLQGKLDAWVAEAVHMRAASPQPAARGTHRSRRLEQRRHDASERPVFALLREAARAGCASAAARNGCVGYPLELQSWVNLHGHC